MGLNMSRPILSAVECLDESIVQCWHLLSRLPTKWVPPYLDPKGHSYLDMGRRESYTIRLGTTAVRRISDCPRTRENFNQLSLAENCSDWRPHKPIFTQRRYQWWPTETRECTTCHCRQEVSPGPGQKMVWWLWCKTTHNWLTLTGSLGHLSYRSYSCPILFLDLFLQITPQYACDACFVDPQTSGFNKRQSPSRVGEPSPHLLWEILPQLQWDHRIFGGPMERWSLSQPDATKWRAWWRVRTLWANMPAALSFKSLMVSGTMEQLAFSSPASSLAWCQTHTHTEKTLEVLKRGSCVMLSTYLPFGFPMCWVIQQNSVLRSPFPACCQNPAPRLPCWDSPWDPSQMSRSLCTIRLRFNKKQSEISSIYVINWLVYFKVQDCQLSTSLATIWFQSCLVYSHHSHFHCGSPRSNPASTVTNETLQGRWCPSLWEMKKVHDVQYSP